MNIPKTLKNIWKPLSLLFAVSFVGASGFYILGFNFWAIFILFLVFQFILFSFVGNILNHYITEERRKKELDALEPLSTILQCSYCHKKNLMVFNPNDVERIEFECDHCKKANLVTMQFVVAQISQPLEIPKVTGIPSEKV